MEIGKRYIFIGVMLLLFILFFIWMGQLSPDPNGFFTTYKKRFSGIIKECTDGMSGSKIIIFKNQYIFIIDDRYKSDTIKDDQLKLQKWGQNLLTYFLQPEDSVFKTKNSDTVFVYRNGTEYIFINRYDNSNNAQ
jgi:hypothetical protein